MSVFAAEGLEFQSFDYEAGDYKTYPMLSMGENEYIITVNNNGIKDDNTGTGKELELSREAEEKVIDNIETAQARFERVVLIDKEGKENMTFFTFPASVNVFVFSLILPSSASYAPAYTSVFSPFIIRTARYA